MHVVLVDPSRVIRKSVSEMLRLGGHTAVGFEDSQAALDHVREDESVTCVLTSLEVHPLDGLELCWSLRALADQRRPLSILVMSSGRERRQLGEVLDSGADDFMAKPPDRSELYARLRAAERVLGLQRALIRQADNDHLTQILNRGGFLRQAQAEIADTAAREPLTVLQLDIDHFKGINDRHGHDVGDVVIRSVADVLRQTGALAGRLGGEEFALLMPGHGLGSAGVVAHRIRTRCAGLPLKVAERDLRFTVSVGVAERSPGDDIETLLKKADVALYAAKTGGRDRVVLASGASLPECVS